MRTTWGRTIAMSATLILPAALAAADDDHPRAAEATATVAADTAGATGTATDTAAPATRSVAKAREGGSDLIYSVDRTPERAFDAPRAADVITADDIRRRGARTLVDLLTERAGVTLVEMNSASGTPVIRGQLGKQLQILVDGVKLNNSVWRDTGLQYLNLIDVDMVERIEIVRGVVSVLGTESLGGAINIITKKGPSGSHRFGATVSTRFSTADDSASVPVQVYGSGDRYRFYAGGVYRRTGELTGGGDVGLQKSSYNEDGGNFHLDYFPSSDKTLSVAYQLFSQNDIDRWSQTFDSTALTSFFNLARLQLGTTSYEDLADHRVFQFLKVTGYWNRQDMRGHEVLRVRPTVDATNIDSQDQFGLNLELRTYLGGHRLIYGVDYTTETIGSTSTELDLKTGLATAIRGRYTDGASYKTTGVYLLDDFKATKWATVIAGARWGRFSSGGSENSSIGKLDLEDANSDLTGQGSLILHAGPHVNLVGSVLHGFRAPNVGDISNFNTSLKAGWEVPSIDATSEKMLAIEGGVKYASDSVSGSVFYFRNDLDRLLVRGPGTFKGLSYFDLNGNSVKDKNEPNVLQKKNIGKALLRGFEADLAYRPLPYLFLRANYSLTVGDDTTAAPTPLSRIPPGLGAFSIRFDSASGRRPWVEAVSQFARPQHRLSSGDITDSRIGPGGTPGYVVFHLRAGLSVTRRFDLMAAWENVFDAKYKYHASALYRPGSQAVFNAQYGF